MASEGRSNTHSRGGVSLERAQNLYALCLARVRERLPPSVGGRGGYAETIAADLAHRFEQQQQQRLQRDDLSEQALNPWIDDEISAAIVDCIERRPDLLWLLTSDMLSQRAKKLGPLAPPGKVGPDSERAVEVRGRALMAMEGGRKALKGWRDQQQGPFLAYLSRSAENALTDVLRLKGSRDFWSGKTRQQDTRGGTDDGAPRRGPVHTADPERQVIRSERPVARQEAVRLLLDVALSHPGDPDCVLVADYLRWILADPHREKPSQAEFARSTQRPNGTISSSLSRFRTSFARRFPQWERASLYTTEGS